MLGEEEPQMLRDAARHLSFAGGKRARPRLVYLFGRAVGASEEDLIDVALAAELIHTASLMHDDVIDEGTIRRGRPTVNAKWNNMVAVLGGDMMLTLAFGRLRNHAHPVTIEAIDLVARMTRASMMEVSALGRLDVGSDVWREIARGKTGALFAWCGWAAAHLAGNKDAEERFSRCGYHLGVAFQMADDLKDVASGDEGKDPFADLRNGNPSFVLYDAIEHAEGWKQKLEEAWQDLPLSQEHASQLGRELLDEGIAARTLVSLEQEIAAAMDALGPYQESEGTSEIISWINAMFYSLCQELERDEGIRQARRSASA